MQLGRLAFIRGDFGTAKTPAGEALGIATDIGSMRVAQSAFDLAALAEMTLGKEIDEDLAEKEPIPVPAIPTKIDQYEVRKLLGVGYFEAVYQAYDPNSGFDVAIRAAHPEALKKSDQVAKKIKREAEILVKLRHPAIPECYGYVVAADQAYIALEYIRGEDLEAMLEGQEGFLPEKDVIECAIQICDGLIHLHSQRPAPIIFRDVKPANVMVDQDGRVHLLLFGISKYRPGREQAASGTEGYAPPEQYFGYTDARSDVYSLGATLHHLLTRRDPRQEILFSFHNAPPRSLNPNISEELEAVILKAVEHNPEDRHQDAEELKTALLACL